jgi:hypothetical protein
LEAFMSVQTVARLLGEPARYTVAMLPAAPDLILMRARISPRWARGCAEELRRSIHFYGGADRHVEDLLRSLDNLSTVPALLRTHH